MSNHPGRLIWVGWFRCLHRLTAPQAICRSSVCCCSRQPAAGLSCDGPPCPCAPHHTSAPSPQPLSRAAEGSPALCCPGCSSAPGINETWNGGKASPKSSALCPVALLLLLLLRLPQRDYGPDLFVDMVGIGGLLVCPISHELPITGVLEVEKHGGVEQGYQFPLLRRRSLPPTPPALLLCPPPPPLLSP